MVLGGGHAFLQPRVPRRAGPCGPAGGGEGSPVTSGSHQGRQRGLGLITFGCPGERQGYLGVDLAPSGGGQVHPVTKRPTRGLEMELAKRTAAGQALRVLGPAGEHNSPSS